MAETKTRPIDASVSEYLRGIADEKKQKDAFELLHLFEQVTGEVAHMYGPSIVGFGVYHYTYDSGHRGVACRTGFAHRSGKFALYISAGYGVPEDALARLGKHKMAKGCLYVNKLADVDLEVLRELVAWAYAESKRHWPGEG